MFEMKQDKQGNGVGYDDMRQKPMQKLKIF